MNIINLEGGSAEPPEPPSGYGPALTVLTSQFPEQQPAEISTVPSATVAS